MLSECTFLGAALWPAEQSSLVGAGGSLARELVPSAPLPGSPLCPSWGSPRKASPDVAPRSERYMVGTGVERVNVALSKRGEKKNIGFANEERICPFIIFIWDEDPGLLISLYESSSF